MPAFLSDDASFYELFERLARQELRAVAGKAHHAPAKIFSLKGAPAARFIRFFPPEFANYVQIGHLPRTASLGPECQTRFRAAYKTPELLQEVTDLKERRAALEELLRVLCGQQESILEFLAPTAAINLKATPLVTLDETWQPPPEEPTRTEEIHADAIETPTPRDGTLDPSTELKLEEELADNLPASFWMLVHEILTEDPQLGVYGFETFDPYRVWVHRQDPLATLIVRYFDGARAWATGAIIPCDQDKNSQLNGGIVYLTETRGDFVPGKPEDSAWHYGFKQLRGEAAKTRLTHVLKTYQEHGGLIFQTGIQGSPSSSTLAHLEQMRHTYHRAEAAEPLTAQLSMFQVFANLYLDDEIGEQQLLWSAQREGARQERIEVLEHGDYPDALLLVYFEPAAGTCSLAAYAPPDRDAATAQTFYRKTEALAAMRELATDRPQPLAAFSPFKSVLPALAVAKLEEALDQLQEGRGSVHQLVLLAKPTADRHA
jgi:hypothetical protein